MSTRACGAWRPAVEQQLRAAAEHIVRLLDDHRGLEVAQLRRKVLEGIVAVVDLIFAHFQHNKAPPPAVHSDPEGVVWRRCGECGKHTEDDGEEAEPVCSREEQEGKREEAPPTGPSDRVAQQRQKKSPGERQVRRHVCEVCGRKFSMSQHLQVHRRIHTGEKPYTCQVCAKDFRQLGNLDAHMKIHTGEKAFVCSLCGKTFRQKVSLETHERFHRKDKVHECHLCDKSFVQKVDLKRHMMTHSGEKPHACAACGKRYQERRSLDAHIKGHAHTCGGHAHKADFLPL
nr:zinc finger protein 32-like isoform X1 [Nerophis lumbriciformis]